ncbi:hypothetical protein C8Q80DRAFT_1269719 [Daedaleopsis nitida]|nr:hypothetical protein C8Q80DRAFT_1269719 [Daedaleopsis nitida]
MSTCLLPICRSVAAAPARPRDLTAIHVKKPRIPTTPAEIFIQQLEILAQLDGAPPNLLDLRMAVTVHVHTIRHPPEGPFRDPDTHILIVTIYASVPTPPLVITLDRYTGDNVDAPKAPLLLAQAICVADDKPGWYPSY